MIPNHHGPAGLVREFHETFDLGAPHKPLDRIPADVKALRRALHDEETLEYTEALNGQLAHLVKEACDLAYVAIGTCVALGVDFERAFREVHLSNMSKTGDDGRPVRRADGKILKGAGYRPPRVAMLTGERAA